MKAWIPLGWLALQLFLAVVDPLIADADIRAKIDSRSFPSVFQAWNPATQLRGKSREEMMAMHDLWFGSAGELGLKWQGDNEGDATELDPESVEVAAKKVAVLRKLNPHLVMLVEVRYRDAATNFLPKDSPYWLRDSNQQLVMGWAEGGFMQLDFRNRAFQELVARKSRALIATGFIDGVMLDWWKDDDDRLALIKAVRKAVGDKLILVNGNDRTFPLTAPYVNGTFMECTQSESVQDWTRIAATLRWAEQATRKPRIDCLETWYHQSRQDFALMRANATMALTESNGYCLFSDPDPLPTPDHLHDWYPFWNKGLGVPLASGAEQPDKSWRRDFTNGTAIYNPMGNGAITVHFKEPHLSRATGRVSTDYEIPPCDGDILIRQSTGR
jgi:hypothetical protein